MPRNTRHTPPHQPPPVAILLPQVGHSDRLPRPSHRLIDSHGLDVAAAAKFIAACTQPGDLVADLTDSPALAAAAEGLNRRLHTPRHAASPEDPAHLLIDSLLCEDAKKLCSITDWLLARRSALSSGGHLVIAVDRDQAQSPTEGGWLFDWAKEVIAAARVAGLIYIQHLITVHQPTHGSPEPATTTPRTGRRVRTHSDLLVFRAPHATGAEGGA